MSRRSVFLGEHTARAMLHEPVNPFLQQRLTDLKLATLLFDQVIVCHERLGSLSSMAAAIGVDEGEFLEVFKSAEYSGSEALDGARMSSVMDIAAAAVDPRRNPMKLWNDKGQVSERMRPFVFSCMRSQGSDPSAMSAEEFDYRAYYSVMSVLLYPAVFMTLKAEDPDLVFYACDEIEAIGLQGLLEAPEDDEPGEAFVGELSQLVPALYALDWSEIFRLRSHRHLERFRARVMDGAEPDERGSGAILDDLFDLTGETMPAIRTTLLKSLVSRIPVPIVGDLLGAVSDGLELWKAIRLRRKFAWVTFVQEVRGNSKKARRR